MKVLVLEDDPKVSRFVSRVLTEEGFAVDPCASGSEAIAHAEAGTYEVLVLDWMVPDVNGLTVCRELRRRGTTTPILMLTARGETRERVLGLDAGADDYLVKPFEVEELVARVKALVRRGAGFAELRCGPLTLDRVGRRATLCGAPLALTAREFALLVRLARRAGATVSRSELLGHVWETSFDPGSNLVEVHVSRLRDKLGEHAWMIETVRGIGYRLRAGLP